MADTKLNILFWTFALLSTEIVADSILQTFAEWKTLDFFWTQKFNFSENPDLYSPKNVVPDDIDWSQDGRMFITTFRSNDVPASLHTLWKTNSTQNKYILKPYPNWPMHRFNPEKINCSEDLINIDRIYIDECQRLWALDNGIVGVKPICTPKLLVFNLTSNEIIYKHVLASGNWYGNKGVTATNLVVENRDMCKNSTVYIADGLNNEIIILQNISIPAKPTSILDFKSDLLIVDDSIDGFSKFVLENATFTQRCGVQGLSLSPMQNEIGYSSRYLFARVLSSGSISAFDTNDIKADKYYYNGFVLKDILSTQSMALAFASDGTLYYDLTEKFAIGCWNIKSSILPQSFKIAVKDVERLKFTSSLKIVKMNGVETLLILTNNLHKLLNGTLNTNEINFRLFTVPVSKLSKICNA